MTSRYQVLADNLLAQLESTANKREMLAEWLAIFEQLKQGPMEHEANRLIAAAPALLDCVQRVAKNPDVVGTLPVLLMQDIVAVLAKVEGRAR